MKEMSDEEKNVQLEMEPAPPQQPSMMNTPPPSYEEAMPVPGSVPIPIPIPKNLNGRSEFGSEPRRMSCWSCYRQVRLSEL